MLILLFLTLATFFVLVSVKKLLDKRNYSISVLFYIYYLHINISIIWKPLINSSKFDKTNTENNIIREPNSEEREELWVLTQEFINFIYKQDLNLTNKDLRDKSCHYAIVSPLERFND